MKPHDHHNPARPADYAVVKYLSDIVRGRQAQELPDGFRYCGIEEYLWDNGQLARSGALSDAEGELVSAAIEAVNACDHGLMPRECFANAQRLVLADRTGALRYQEGYAVGGIALVVHHAWVSINGKVADLTWELQGANEDEEPVDRHPVGVLPDDYGYLGVIIGSREYIARRLRERGFGDSLLTDWEEQFPLLRGLDPDELA